MASPSFTGMVFPCPEAMFCAAVAVFGVFFGSRAGHVVFSLFGKVSDDTFGGFLALLCGFSVLHWYGVSLSRCYVLGCRVWFLAVLQPCWTRTDLAVFQCFFVDSPCFTGMVFPCPGAMFHGLSCLVFGVFSSLPGHVVFSSFGISSFGRFQTTR